MLFCRVDDFPYTKKEEMWRHNLESFKLFDAVMKKHNLGYFLAVIPNNVTIEQLEWLSIQDNITIAMHGIRHEEKQANEFKQWQTSKDIFDEIVLARNKLELHGKKKVDVYIPPHNFIDSRTCEALSRAGFKSVLCGPETNPSVLLYGKQTLKLKMFCSGDEREYGRSDELQKNGSVKYFSYLAHKQDVFLSLHFTWECDIGVDKLDSYLKLLDDVIRIGR